MPDCAISEQAALSLQVLNDGLIGLLDVDALVGINHRKEFSILIDGDWGFAGLDDTISHASSIIIFTKTWCAMNDTSTCVFGDEGGAKHLEASIVGPVLEKVKQGFIAFANNCLSFELLKDFVSFDFSLLNDVVETAFHADVNFLSRGVLPAHIVQGRVNCQSQVAWECPGSGCPGDEVCLLTILKNRKCDDNCGIRNVLVVGASLEV